MSAVVRRSAPAGDSRPPLLPEPELGARPSASGSSSSSRRTACRPSGELLHRPIFARLGLRRPSRRTDLAARLARPGPASPPSPDGSFSSTDGALLRALSSRLVMRRLLRLTSHGLVAARRRGARGQAGDSNRAVARGHPSAPHLPRVAPGELRAALRPLPPPSSVATRRVGTYDGPFRPPAGVSRTFVGHVAAQGCCAAPAGDGRVGRESVVGQETGSRTARRGTARPMPSRDRASDRSPHPAAGRRPAAWARSAVACRTGIGPLVGVPPAWIARDERPRRARPRLVSGVACRSRY